MRRGTFKKARCANRCGKDAKFKAGLTNVCSNECAAIYGLRKAKKEKDKALKEKKAAYMETKKSTRLRAAKEACHLYIRLRDKNEVCICCGEPLGDDYQAGHFMESGNYSATRYDEDNIHGQRKRCNLHKGGDSGEYEIRLRAKIGNDAVDRIHRIKSKVTKYSVDDLRKIEEYYKAKILELQQ